MKKIDTHQHFWLFDEVKDAWIAHDMEVIRRDFLPEDLLPVLQYNNIEGCIAVQASQSEEENEFLLGLAQRYPFIKGVVGWVDLRAADAEERLAHYSSVKCMKGFRHIVQGEPDGFMRDAAFRNGISLLSKYGFTYDILIKHHQLQEAAELVAAFPQQKFVIDHLAKPAIKSGEIAAWQKDIEAIAQYPNVSCKISGFCTEADWYHWQLSEIKPYLDVVFSAFGDNRVMYGSDWPVSLLAGGYNRVFQAVSLYMKDKPVNVQEHFWAVNAIEFYNLNN